jgi:hypothetical protein
MKADSIEQIADRQHCSEETCGFFLYPQSFEQMPHVLPQPAADEPPREKQAVSVFQRAEVLRRHLPRKFHRRLPTRQVASRRDLTCSSSVARESSGSHPELRPLAGPTHVRDHALRFWPVMLDTRPRVGSVQPTSRRAYPAAALGLAVPTTLLAATGLLGGAELPPQVKLPSLLSARAPPPT